MRSTGSIAERLALSRITIMKIHITLPSPLIKILDAEMLNNNTLILLLASLGISQLFLSVFGHLNLFRPTLSSCSPETLSNDVTPTISFLPGSSTASPTRGLDFAS